MKKTRKTKKVKPQVIYVQNVGSAMKEYIEKGYHLEFFHQSAEQELRFYLRHPDKGNVYLVREVCEELYPDRQYRELWVRPEEDYKKMYLDLKSRNLIAPVPNDDLTNVPVLQLSHSAILIINALGYTWS